MRSLFYPFRNCRNRGEASSLRFFEKVWQRKILKFLVVGTIWCRSIKACDRGQYYAKEEYALLFLQFVWQVGFV